MTHSSTAIRDSFWGNRTLKTPLDDLITVQPFQVRLKPKELETLVRPLMAAGLGDCSIAVRLNNAGYACQRVDIFAIRHNRRAPTD